MIPAVTPEELAAKLNTVDIGVQHHFGAGVYIRQMHLPAGHSAVTHAHEYDHFAMLGSGEAALDCNGIRTEHQGPCVLTIKRGVNHRIIAKSDITWFCIHACDADSPEQIENILMKGA